MGAGLVTLGLPWGLASCLCGVAVGCTPGPSEMDYCPLSRQGVVNGSGAGVSTTSAMIPVPAGLSWMGCDSGGEWPVNEPLLLVWVDTFDIDRFEASVGEYRACVAAGECSPALPERSPDTSECAICEDDSEMLPMNCISWSNARTYCKWAGKRLCTAAEWEKAVRGICNPENDVDCCLALQGFPWGNALPDCGMANIGSGADGEDCERVHAVRPGSFHKDVSTFGAYDMVGNLSEWIDESCHENIFAKMPGVACEAVLPISQFAGAGIAQCASMIDSVCKAPTRPTAGICHGARGGNYGSHASDTFAYSASCYCDLEVYKTVGVRCCK